MASKRKKAAPEYLPPAERILAAKFLATSNLGQPEPRSADPLASSWWTGARPRSVGGDVRLLPRARWARLWARAGSTLPVGSGRNLGEGAANVRDP